MSIASVHCNNIFSNCLQEVNFSHTFCRDRPCWGKLLTWLINELMVPQDFSAFVFLYFVLNTRFLNSTMATALNLAEQHYQGIFCCSAGSKSNGRLGLFGLAILLLLRVSCFTRWLSGASEFLICPKMEATTYKDTYTAGAVGVH